MTCVVRELFYYTPRRPIGALVSDRPQVGNLPHSERFDTRGAIGYPKYEKNSHGEGLST